MSVEKAGCIIVSRGSPRKILMLHRIKSGDWSFPKGHVEEGEGFEQCALREVKEETGLDVTIVSEFGTFEYKDKNKRNVKAVYFTAAADECLKTNPEQGCEVEWVRVEDVAAKITYSNLREFFALSIDKIT